MKRIFGIVIVFLFWFISLTVFTGKETIASDIKEGKISAEELINHLDLNKHTKAQIEEYVRHADGKIVYGTGKVVDIESGRRGKFKVLILVKSSVHPAHGKYNVVLHTENPNTLKLNKGERVKFEGIFERKRSAFYGTTARQKVGISVDIKGDYSVVK